MKMTIHHVVEDLDCDEMPVADLTTEESSPRGF